MKRIVSVILTLSMLAGAFSVSIGAQEYIHDDSYTVGDVDGSGSINAVDSLAVKATLVGAEGYELDINAADFDADGITTSMDSFYLRLCLSGQKSVSDFESSASLYKLTVGGYDISDFCIVIPAGSTSADNADYAADELQKYIEEATGTYLRICYSDEARTADHAFVFNAIDEESELGAELGVEGYKYDITNGDVNIYGTRRGNMYWVYDFLERLGYVFFSNDATFIWEKRSVHVPEGESDTVIPSLEFRFAGQSFGSGGAREHYFPNKLNGTQIYSYAEPKYGTLTGPHFINAHSVGYYWRMGTGTYTDDEHLQDCYNSGEQKQETDYGSVRAWQPCTDPASGDYDVLFLGMTRTMTMIQQWSHVFRKETSSMSFSICDNTGGYCTCRYCARLSRTEGYSGVYLALTNRAAVDIKEIYPDMKVLTIIYDHTIPATVRPEENVIIYFCGQGCNNHYFGSSEECGDNGPVIGSLTNAYAEKALKAWTDMCHEAGASMWFWYYPVTYRVVIAPCPNVLNVYYDMMFVLNECGVDGFYYEGGGEMYAFEALKAHMAVQIMNHPDMTYDEFVEGCKEFLYIYYGDGYELIWEYILMQTEAGNLESCYLNNYSLPAAMYDMTYLEANYKEMRQLISDAAEMTSDADQLRRLYMLMCTCDFMGLSAVYDSWYTNGTDETKAEYSEKLEWMLGYVKANGMHFGEPSFLVPETVDYSQSLLEQVVG